MRIEHSLRLLRACCTAASSLPTGLCAKRRLATSPLLLTTASEHARRPAIEPVPPKMHLVAPNFQAYFAICPFAICVLLCRLTLRAPTLRFQQGLRAGFAAFAEGEPGALMLLRLAGLESLHKVVPSRPSVSPDVFSVSGQFLGKQLCECLVVLSTW